MLILDFFDSSICELMKGLYPILHSLLSTFNNGESGSSLIPLDLSPLLLYFQVFIINNLGADLVCAQST